MIRRSFAACALALIVGAGCSSASSTTYANCDAAQKAGKAPLHKGDPGYSSKLDRDGDGVACD